MSQWADSYRKLSPEASAEPGQWVTARAEYQRGILDASSDPLCKEVVVMSSAQVGKTELLINTIGFYVHQNPSPILLLQPTVEMAEAFSKDRITPMVRDTPALKELIADPKSRSSGNTVLHKSFPGGHITMAGANSPASLASRPVRVVLCDEVDRYPFSAGPEGDPVNLAKKRTTTFWNRKVILTSTPTLKGVSRIETAYQASDRRRYFVPCPACGELHLLSWPQIKWEAERPKEAWHECPYCQHQLTSVQKLRAVSRGEWRAELPFNGVAGFHLNELYSPWRSFGEVVEDFLAAKENPTQLQVWVNTSLGETWEEAGGESLDWELLAEKAEPYEQLSVPSKALFLTAGVDVQADRLAVLVTAWGRGEECWVIYWGEIYGNPTLPQVWDELEAVLTASYTHQSGSELPIVATLIDSGYKPQEVYAFCRGKSKRKVYPSKGLSVSAKPILGKPSYQQITYRGRVLKKGARLWPVGTDTAKQLLYSRLKLTSQDGPGAIHTPQGIGEEFYQQLTAEKLQTKFTRGFPSREWVKVRARNEALDCWVYSYAAAIMAGITRANWSKLETALQEGAKVKVKAKPEPEPELKQEAKTNQEPEIAEDLKSLIDPPELKTPTPNPRSRRRSGSSNQRNGFINRW